MNWKWLAIGGGLSAFWLLSKKAKAVSSIQPSPGPNPSRPPTAGPPTAGPPQVFNLEASAIADKAVEEFEYWDGRQETDSRMRARLDEYWRSAGIGPQDPSEVPWSAAFVTHVIQSTVPGALLPTGAHINYTRDAYKNRGQSGKYGAFDPYELSIQPSDIIVTSRGDQLTTWADITSGSGDFRKTHGDIVVSATPGMQAEAIGGNVGNSVDVNTYPLDERGRLVRDSKPYVAVLRLQ